MKRRRPLWHSLLAGVWAFFMLVAASPLALPTGATAQGTLHTQAHAVYDVKAFFGAVGNGVSDDTDNIQDAIDAANVAGGGTVWLPGPATYLCLQLLLKSNVVIDGDRSAVLKLKNSTNEEFIEATSRDACGVKNITIDCNKAGQSAGFHAGINLIGSTNWFVRDTHIKNSSDDGIYVGYTTTPSSGGVIAGNHITGVDRNGISITSAYGVTVANNVIDNCGLCGIDVEVNNPTDYARDITISGNAIAVCGAGIGVICGTSNNGSIAVTGNTIRNINTGSGAYPTGIVLSGATPNCSVTGNTIADVDNHGIHVLGSSTGAVISGNTIDASSVNGIFLESCLDAACSGNTIRTTGAEGIRLGASGRMSITGNTVILSGLEAISALSGGDHYTITGNTIVFTGNLAGVRFDSSSLCTIAGNSVHCTGSVNGTGVYFGAATPTKNTIVGNSFSNLGTGINLQSSTGNLVGYNESASCTNAVTNANTNRFLTTQHVAAATPTGGVSGDIKVGNGKIWVNDAGTWKSVAIA